MRRYFEPVVTKPIGGAIAYPILYGNRQLLLDQHEPEAVRVLASILERDHAYTGGEPTKALFNFWIAKPIKAALTDLVMLERWSREENERETRARANGLRYYERQTLELIYDELSDLRVAGV